MKAIHFPQLGIFSFGILGREGQPFDLLHNKQQADPKERKEEKNQPPVPILFPRAEFFFQAIGCAVAPLSPPSTPGLYLSVA